MHDYAKDFQEIDQKIKSFPHESVNFVFVTDTHVDPYLRRDANNQLTVFEAEDSVMCRMGRIVAPLQAAVEWANNDDTVDFIALGGDLINAYNLRGKDHVIDEMLLKSIEPLKDCQKPVVIAFGNHDDNAFQTLNPDVKAVDLSWIISDKDWKDRVLGILGCAKDFVHDPTYPDSKYYYYDLTNKKTRVIVLDTMDARRPYDENGTVIDAPRLPRITYTFPQLEWLVKEALTCGADWQYIFISHMGVDNATNSNKMGNGEILREILRACQTQESTSFTYTNLDGKEITVTADFRNGVGKVKMFAFGHQHADLALYSEDIDLWQVSSGCENGWGGCGVAGSDKSLPWTSMKWEGIEGNLDVISVGSSYCYKFNIGAGKDVEMKYPQK